MYTRFYACIRGFVEKLLINKSLRLYITKPAEIVKKFYRILGNFFLGCLVIVLS